MKEKDQGSLPSGNSKEGAKTVKHKRRALDVISTIDLDTYSEIAMNEKRR